MSTAAEHDGRRRADWVRVTRGAGTLKGIIDSAPKRRHTGEGQGPSAEASDPTAIMPISKPTIHRAPPEEVVEAIARSGRRRWPAGRRVWKELERLSRRRPPA